VFLPLFTEASPREPAPRVTTTLRRKRPVSHAGSGGTGPPLFSFPSVARPIRLVGQKGRNADLKVFDKGARLPPLFLLLKNRGDLRRRTPSPSRSKLLDVARKLGEGNRSSLPSPGAAS